MPYQFPPDIELRIRAQMDQGEFTNEDEVLREAMEALESRQSSLKQLRDLVAVADDDIAAGRVGPFDAEKTKTRVRQRLADHGVTE